MDAELMRMADDGCPHDGPAEPVTETDFTCQVCGRDCCIAPELPARAVCEDHCEAVHGEHVYEYDRFERETRCKNCFKLREWHWND